MSNQEESVSIAEVIKELRQITGLSQSKFAEKFSIGVSNIQHWEQGVSVPPEYVVGMMKDLLYIEHLFQEAREENDIKELVEDIKKEVNNKLLLRDWAITLLHAIAENYVIEIEANTDNSILCTFSDDRLQDLLHVPAKKLREYVKAAMQYIFDHPYILRTDKYELHQMWVSSVNYTEGGDLEIELNSSLLDIYTEVSKGSEPDYGLSEYL